MNGRRGCFILACGLAWLVLTGCPSAPDTLPDVADVITGQQDVITGADGVADGAGTVADQADELAAALAGNEALAEKAALHARAARKLADEAKALKASVERANLAIIRYIKDSEQAIKGKADALLKAEKYKGQRNSFFLGAVILLLLLVGPKILKMLV